MKVYSAREIKYLEEATIKLEPVTSMALMERAANAAFLRIKDKLSEESSVAVFAGPGNNGGDGLVIARLLKNEGYQLRVFLIETGVRHSTEQEANLQRLNKSGIIPVTLTDTASFPVLSPNETVIDAIFGSGLTRPPSGLAADAIRMINSSGTYVISIDVPSGLFCDDNSTADPSAIIKASLTLTFQFPKLSFMFAGTSAFVDKWEVLDIGLHAPTISSMPSAYQFVEAKDIRPVLRKRKKFDHKGAFGHALIIAGSHGKAGAAILAAAAAMRTGAGLVTVHTPGSAVIPIQSALPEAMVSPDPGAEFITTMPDLARYNAVGVGPGLGTDPDTRNAITDLLKSCNRPLVLDADALNILALEPEALALLPPGSILTPHPGEFKRLAKTDKSDYQLLMIQREFASKHNCIIVLKGSCTSVALPDGKVYFNSTGNPGMATGGTGDVLTGMITSMLAQEYPPEQAAVAAVYLHGAAGDLALRIHSEESLIAGDIIINIGRAFRETMFNNFNMYL
ncbi:MAG TPA: NAD(P)H-hydrate dehydratase [Bacteroidales bacterium]|nr:NAD(P)H-hydrate dehydratase [Bacteroidales bacterium]